MTDHANKRFNSIRHHFAAGYVIYWVAIRTFFPVCNGIHWVEILIGHSTTVLLLRSALDSAAPLN